MKVYKDYQTIRDYILKFTQDERIVSKNYVVLDFLIDVDSLLDRITEGDDINNLSIEVYKQGTEYIEDRKYFRKSNRELVLYQIHASELIKVRD